MPKPDFQEVLASPVKTYAEELKFFRGRGMINKALRRLVDDLDRCGIAHSIIGVVALDQHGYKRFTGDISLLLSLDSQFAEQLDPYVRDKYLELHSAIIQAQETRE